jgi:hypothetical protein
MARSLAPLGVLALVACSGAPPPATAASPAAATLTALGPAEGATPVDIGCAAGAAERCEGVDNDCDGRIDEGACEGPVDAVATLAWVGPADLDLVLRAPDGTDVATAADAGCGDPPLERLTLTAEAPAPGTYALVARYAAACDGEGPITASVSASLGGMGAGPVNADVEAGGEASLVELVFE